MRFFAILSMFALSGCIGPLVPVAQIDEQSAISLERTTHTYEAGQTPKGAANLGPIEAVSCKNLMWDPAPTRQNAIAQLRQYARERGGNAVGEISCGDTELTNLVKNCWASLTCRGVALRTPS